MTDTMDKRAKQLVHQYICDQHEHPIEIPHFDCFIVWKCKTLQNWKYLISTTLEDGMYYEMTFSGDKREWYLDAYKKVENLVIAED